MPDYKLDHAISFHRTFSLNRPAITQILFALHTFSSLDQDETVIYQYLRTHTSLGTVQIASFFQYAKRIGFVGHDYRLTRLGLSILRYDKSISSLASQWVAHYHIASPHNVGVPFWHYLTTEVIAQGYRLHRNSILAALSRALTAGGCTVSSRTIRTAVTVFLGSYTKPDGLDRLRLLQPVGRDEYLVQRPAPVPLWTFAYALVDYWTHAWGDRLSVNLNELLTPGGLGSIFFLGAQQLEDLLERLRHEGLLDLYRVAPPFQVVRRWPDGILPSILERMYAEPGT